MMRLMVTLLTLALILYRSHIEPGDPTERVRAFTRQIEFNYIDWTLKALKIKLEQIGLGSENFITADDQHQLMLDYLALVADIQHWEAYLNEYYAHADITDPETASQLVREELAQMYTQRDHLAPLAENVLQSQIAAIAAEMGLGLGGQPLPPVLYRITPLPLALIVSPRETIRQDANISLDPNFTLDQRAALEGQVDQALGVSSLIVNIGGVGMYPTMVMQTTNLNWLAEVVAHEWVHNYLTLRPLGASYMQSTELRIINETAASLAGKEIGAALIERYYHELAPPPEPEAEEPSSESTQDNPYATDLEKPFEYRAEMHETRLTADALLAEGKIEEAETYMEARRQIFVENGYSIRKLNQAFFAFHGAYADSPGGAAGAAEDPIGEAVRTLRAQSSSLAEFLYRISWIWSFEQLETLIESDMAHLQK